MFIKFIKESIKELRYRMSWPSYRELERLVFLFIVGFLIWGLFMFGLNRSFQMVQETLYKYISKKEISK